MTQNSSTASKTASALFDFIPRPKTTGTKGRSVTIQSNCFEVHPTFYSGIIYHYDVNINYHKSSQTINRKIWNKFEDMENHRVFSNNCCYAVYDGQKKVFSLKPLNINPDRERNIFQVEYKNDSSDPNSAKVRDGDGVFKLSIKKSGHFNITELQQYLKGEPSSTKDALIAIRALDATIRHMSIKNYPITIGHARYTPKNNQALPSGIEIWQGIYQSVRTGVNKLFVNIDVLAMVFQKHTLLPNAINQLDLNDINEEQEEDILNSTNQNPRARFEKIQREGYPLMNYENNPYMQRFKIKVNPHMVTINARILQPPLIVHHENSINNPIPVPCNGAWNFNGLKVVVGAKLTCWSIANFAEESLVPSIKTCVTKNICPVFSQIGIHVESQYPLLATMSGRINDIERDLKQLYDSTADKSDTKRRPQLIICILPNKNNEKLYGEIKRVSDTILGVPTQCINSVFVTKPKNLEYTVNVGLKINVKLGGINWLLNKNEIPFVTQVPTIVFGAVLTRPTTTRVMSSAPDDNNNSNHQPSIAALTASLDHGVARHASVVRVQTGRSDTIESLKEMIIQLFRIFYLNTQRKPEQVLFYREAVLSENRYIQVMHDELELIREAFDTLEQGYNPRITFIKAQKQHHVRLFPTSSHSSDPSGNCPSGTVVDTEIVHPFGFDFCKYAKDLQSHAGTKGTSRPTHYHVLHDENNFSSDGLQELTHRLCYSYCSTPHAISVVPSLYYASLLAARARYHRKLSEDIKKLDIEQQLACYAPVHKELHSGNYDSLLFFFFGAV